MRGETTTEETEVGDDKGEDAAALNAASGDRRPSVERLQNMLKKVSKSPFQNQYMTLVSSNSESSGSSANDSVNKQDGDFLSDLSVAVEKKHRLLQGQNGSNTENKTLPHPAARNGVKGGLARSNPFYSYYLESGSKGHSREDTGRKTSEEVNFDAMVVPPPEFQSSPLDPQTGVKTLENTPNHVKPSTNGHLHNGKQSSPDLLNFSDTPPSLSDDPFKSPSNNKDDPSKSTQPKAANPFYTSTAKEVDLFQGIHKSEELATKESDFKRSSKDIMDIFSPSSTSAVDPFPSPITRNLFHDTSSFDDPFGATPSKDPFQDVSNSTPDIFKPLPPKPTSRLDGTKMDMVSSPDLLKAAPPESNLDTQTTSADRPQDVFLTTPGGTKHDILPPSPFTRARNLSMSPSQSQMNHVQTFKRPPKPLPRTKPPKTEKSPGSEKPPRPEKPPKPERPPMPANLIEPEQPVRKTSPKLSFKRLPKPVIHRKPKTPENKPVDAQNYVVFEDILLIGQEKCVEDWPEDSPQLDPDFKPSGTLRLRRESYKKEASEEGSGEEQDSSGSQVKKKDKKHRMSILSRRGSKDKFPDDTAEGKSRTLPIARKSSKDYLAEWNSSAGENEDEEQNGLEYKKKPLKTKVNALLRRASTNSYTLDGKHMNGHLPQESKQDDDRKGVSKKNSIIRRWSEGTVLDGSTGEEEEDGAGHGEKKKKKMKIKFVPHRGFAITVEKTDDLKGASGLTSRKNSKDKSQDEVLGAYGYTPRKKSQEDAFEDVEEIKRRNLQSASKADFMDDEQLQRALQMSAGINGDEDPYGEGDVKPKKPTKMKLLNVGRRSSKEDMLDDYCQKKKSSLSAEELDDEELKGMDKLKKFKQKVPIPPPRKPKTANGQIEMTGFSSHMPEPSADDVYAEDDAQTGNEFLGPEEMYASDQDEVETCKPKKLSKLKRFKKFKSKSKAMQDEDPPGATSGDYLSEAAKAEWLAAQMDERAAAGSGDEDDEGDTDSLMEWWNTVEQWDEVPSDEEDKILKEDESKSFSILADKVHRGLRVYNKVFTERAEVLWQSIIKLHTIADDISTFHHKAKIAGITGGTTTAVGGVAAIAGLALAPVTLGASLVITAVGVGVATAGGIASASAAISDNVNNMHDRKKVEVVLQEYETHLLDIGKILHFVNQGLYKLRGHPFLRSGTQHYSKDWEIRRAVQMTSLVDSPVMRATEVTDAAIASVQGLFGGMDKYFIKDSRELKKGCKKEVVAQIKEVANVLNDGIVELNAIREELQDATGVL